MNDGSNYLDPNRPDAVRLSVSDARALNPHGHPVPWNGEPSGRNRATWGASADFVQSRLPQDLPTGKASIPHRYMVDRC
jgi:hypothetical protein